MTNCFLVAREDTKNLFSVEAELATKVALPYGDVREEHDLYGPDQQHQGRTSQQQSLGCLTLS